MTLIKAGIIGCGVGEAHIAGIESHPGCEVLAVCDFDPVKRDYMKDKYVNLSVVENADEILTDPMIQVVSVASYDNFHAEQILTALKNGKHVFVEKPLCLTPEDAVKIREELNKNPHLKLSSNLILRKSPRFIWLRNEYQKGLLGTLNYCEADYNYGRIHKITEGWRGSIDYYSVFYGGGIHVTDLLMWITGMKPVEVMAYGNRIATEGTRFKYNDVVAALMKFENGMIAKVTSNYSCVYPHFHRLMLYGNKATYSQDVLGEGMIVSRDPEAVSVPSGREYPGVHKGDLIKNFVESIAVGAEPEVTADDVFNSMSVCFAVEQSMNHSKPVKVEYI